MNLYLVSLVAAIGRNRRHSLQWAYVKFLFLVCLALVSGLSLAGNVGFSSSVPQAIDYNLASIASFSAEVIFAMVLLGSAHLFKRTTFAMLLQTLPIRRHQRTIALLIPDICLCLLILLVIGIPLHNLLASIGLSDWLSGLSILIGVLCSFGLVYGLYAQRYKTLIRLGILGVQLLGCRLIFLQHLHTLGVVIILTCLLGLMACVLQVSRVTNKVMPKEVGQFVYRVSLPSGAWMLQKVLGNRRSVVSVALLCTYSVGLAIASCLHYLPPNIACALSAILAASFMSDIRGITRKYTPAEIANLKGVAYFMRNLVWGLICSLVIFMPVLISIRSDIIQGSLLCISQLLLGISVGLFSSCIFVPQDRDIHSQFITVLLSLLLFVLLPQLPVMQTHSPPLASTYNILMSLVAIVSSYGIEYKRNTFFWR